MTVSFHKFGEYFPGTGDVKDKVCCAHVPVLYRPALTLRAPQGADKGDNYTVNVPLNDGMDDASYRLILYYNINEIVLFIILS